MCPGISTLQRTPVLNLHSLSSLYNSHPKCIAQFFFFFYQIRGIQYESFRFQIELTILPFSIIYLCILQHVFAKNSFRLKIKHIKWCATNEYMCSKPDCQQKTDFQVKKKTKILFMHESIISRCAMKLCYIRPNTSRTL